MSSTYDVKLSFDICVGSSIERRTVAWTDLNRESSDKDTRREHTRSDILFGHSKLGRRDLATLETLTKFTPQQMARGMERLHITTSSMS